MTTPTECEEPDTMETIRDKYLDLLADVLDAKEIMLKAGIVQAPFAEMFGQYALRAALASPQPAGMSAAEQVCAEAYQVAGSLLSDLGRFNTLEARKIMDNLSAAKRVHADVLPWLSYEAQPATVEPAPYVMLLHPDRSSPPPVPATVVAQQTKALNQLLAALDKAGTGPWAGYESGGGEEYGRALDAAILQARAALASTAQKGGA